MRLINQFWSSFAPIKLDHSLCSLVLRNTPRILVRSMGSWFVLTSRSFICKSFDSLRGIFSRLPLLFGVLQDVYVRSHGTRTTVHTELSLHCTTLHFRIQVQIHHRKIFQHSRLVGSVLLYAVYSQALTLYFDLMTFSLSVSSDTMSAQIVWLFNFKCFPFRLSHTARLVML